MRTNDSTVFDFTWASNLNETTCIIHKLYFILPHIFLHSIYTPENVAIQFYHEILLTQITVIAKGLGKSLLPLPGPEVIKLFSCSTQLSTEFILLINVKMPTIFGILTFISMINTTPERLKVKHFFVCLYFSFYDQVKFRAQLSREKNL